jgi:hypothetical protein
LFLISEQGVRLDEGKLRSSIYVARSRDGGTTFDEPVKIVANGLINKSEMPVVLPGGTLLVSFVDIAENLDTVTGMPTPSDRRRAWVVRSTDGGHTFSMPFFVSEECGPPPAFQLSSFAADVSNSPFQNRLYFACRQKGCAELLDRCWRALDEGCSSARGRCRYLEEHTGRCRE